MLEVRRGSLGLGNFSVTVFSSLDFLLADRSHCGTFFGLRDTFSLIRVASYCISPRLSIVRWNETRLMEQIMGPHGHFGAGDAEVVDGRQSGVGPCVVGSIDTARVDKTSSNLLKFLIFDMTRSKIHSGSKLSALGKVFLICLIRVEFFISSLNFCSTSGVMNFWANCGTCSFADVKKRSINNRRLPVSV